MEKFHIIVDLAKCVGCFNCQMACKDEHVGNCWLPYTDEQQRHDENWIEPVRHERGKAPYTDLCFVPKVCQHCDDPACQNAAPEAVTKRSDGIVLLNPEKAKKNRNLVKACPYGAISWNEELEVAQKCTLCAHLLDNGWKEPRCVQACPLRALSIVKCEDSEFEKIVENQCLKPLYEGNYSPRVLYKNLDRYKSNFISGALAYMDGEIEVAAEGAHVELIMGGEVLKEEKTDMFGEYKFDHIPSDVGTFEIVASLKKYKPIRIEVTMADESICLDVVRFEPV